MKKEINLGIGFVTGRTNVCKIINSYYKDMIEQISKSKDNIKITLFILYDLNYQFTTRTDFYNIIPDVYRNITIKGKLNGKGNEKDFWSFSDCKSKVTAPLVLKSL